MNNTSKSIVDMNAHGHVIICIGQVRSYLTAVRPDAASECGTDAGAKQPAFMRRWVDGSRELKQRPAYYQLGAGLPRPGPSRPEQTCSYQAAAAHIRVQADGPGCPGYSSHNQSVMRWRFRTIVQYTIDRPWLRKLQVQHSAAWPRLSYYDVYRIAHAESGHELVGTTLPRPTMAAPQYRPDCSR